MKLTKIMNSILSESSLSRVWQHINNDKSFGVISAFRETNDDATNKNLHKSLIDDVKSLNLGYIQQKSGYTYSSSDGDGRVEEISLFIPNISLEDIIKLGKKYNQESILFKDATQFVLVDCNSKSIILNFSKKTSGKNGNDFITFKPEVLKYAYSQLIKSNKNSKKPFAFTSIDEIYELRIPSRTDSYRMVGTGNLAEARWVRIS